MARSEAARAIQLVLDAAREQGFDIESRKTCIMVRNPLDPAKAVAVSYTPGGKRGLKNDLSALKRIGVQYDPYQRKASPVPKLSEMVHFVPDSDHHEDSEPSVADMAFQVWKLAEGECKILNIETTAMGGRLYYQWSSYSPNRWVIRKYPRLHHKTQTEVLDFLESCDNIILTAKVSTVVWYVAAEYQDQPITKESERAVTESTAVAPKPGKNKATRAAGPTMLRSEDGLYHCPECAADGVTVESDRLQGIQGHRRIKHPEAWEAEQEARKDPDWQPPRVELRAKSVELITVPRVSDPTPVPPQPRETAPMPEPTVPAQPTPTVQSDLDEAFEILRDSVQSYIAAQAPSAEAEETIRNLRKELEEAVEINLRAREILTDMDLSPRAQLTQLSQLFEIS